MTTISETIPSTSELDLRLWLSEPRYSVYASAANGDPQRAYDLYLWNANLSQVLLRDISFFEVALRNSQDRCLSERWVGESHWLLDPASPVRRPILRKSRGGSAFDANDRNRQMIGRITDGPRGTSDPNRIVSRLTLGFWTHLFDTNHERDLWIPYLHAAWPKGTNRSELYSELNTINVMRNRAAHSEKLFDLRGGLSVRACDETIVRLMHAISPAVADQMTENAQLTPVERYLRESELDKNIRIRI